MKFGAWLFSQRESVLSQLFRYSEPPLRPFYVVQVNNHKAAKIDKLILWLLN